jgi:hypothetical protein
MYASHARCWSGVSVLNAESDWRGRLRDMSFCIIGARAGEDSNWRDLDEVAFLVDGIRGKTHIPPSPLLQ